jgi:NAD(P)H-hydrate epimerase
MSIPYEPGEPLTVQQIRELDVLAIEHVGIPGLVLMENAAGAVADFVYAALVNPRRDLVVVLCGPGNNGGDGFVTARRLENAGVPVAVVLAAPRDRIRGDAAINLAIYERMEARVLDAGDPEGLAEARPWIERAAVIVDALLGSGSRGAPTGLLAELIRLSNAAPRARRIAVDIPTGLDADSGQVASPCFQADATVTFVAEKVGFGAATARAVLGRVLVADSGAPRKLIPGRKNDRAPLDC